MIGAALLATAAAGTIVAAHLLSRARWTWRMPRTAIALWQALGLAWGVATIGTLLGIALMPYGDSIAGGLPRLARDSGDRLEAVHLAALLGALVLALALPGTLLVAIYRVVRVRRRHRALLALIARGEPDGTLVLDHPAAAAYCVPGMRSAKVVVSAGTLRLLDAAELAAVLAHERAHARERHDLVLLPFFSLRQFLPHFGLVRRSLDAVGLLIEMTADDRARRHRAPYELATALLRFAAARPAAAPCGTLGAVGTHCPAVPAPNTLLKRRTIASEPIAISAVLARVQRLTDLTPAHPVTRVAVLGAAGLIAVTPPLLYTLPH